MRPVVIIGSGGHAKVVLEILEDMQRWQIVGCTTVSARSRQLLSHPILGGDDVLTGLVESGVCHAIVAIGDNLVRRRVSEQAVQTGFELIQAVSARAIVSARARIGSNVAVMAGAVIQVDTVIEDGVIVNTGATIDHDCRVGAFAHVAPGAHLAGRVEVGEGAFLGVGCSVIPGVRIGAWAVVGAGAAVIEDVPDGTTVVGVPARALKQRSGL